MGSRLSVPRGVAGTTEASHLKELPHPLRRPFNSRQLIAPLAAFTMAGILFVYARTSIHAAKQNAQRHRDLDSGGAGLNLLNESRRRHGLEKRIDDRNSVSELVSDAKQQILGTKSDLTKPVTTAATRQSPAPDRLREALSQRKRGGDS